MSPETQKKVRNIAAILKDSATWTREASATGAFQRQAELLDELAASLEALALLDAEAATAEKCSAVRTVKDSLTAERVEAAKDEPLYWAATRKAGKPLDAPMFGNAAQVESSPDYNWHPLYAKSQQAVVKSELQATAGTTEVPEALRLAASERRMLQTVRSHLNGMAARFEDSELRPCVKELVGIIDDHLSASPQMVYALPPMMRATLQRWRELMHRDLQSVVADMDRMLAGIPPLLMTAPDCLPPLRPMASAPRDRIPVLLKFRDNLSLLANETRDRLHGFSGRYFVGRRESQLDGQDVDMGWSFAAPVGVGGFDEYLLEGWLPLPEPKQQSEKGS